MLRGRVLRSTPFRLAFLFSTLFVTTFIVSNFIALQTARIHLLEKLDRDVANTFAILAAANAGDDVEDLTQAVENQVAIFGSSPDNVLLLVDADGKRLAGNVDLPNPPQGVSTITGNELGLEDGERFRLFSGPVGPNRLIVGKSYAEVDEVGEIVGTTFMWATGFALAAAIAGAALLAARLQRRMGEIAGTLALVSAGDLSARIPIYGSDDIETISRQINGTLDRLGGLFEGMKQVSADIAHDLKSPLNRLKLTIRDAIARQAEGLPVRDELAEADAESDRINDTFDALLRIAQLEAGARKSGFGPTALNEIAAEIAEIYVDVAADSGVTLLFDTGMRDAIISGDRELLIQMVANLVENTITHCPPGTRVNLTLNEIRDSIVLRVSDNGPGIPPDEHSRVLDRLYRLERSRTTPGSGLGLSLVKAIADLHGAHVLLADNKPGLIVTASFPKPPK